MLNLSDADLAKLRLECYGALLREVKDMRVREPTALEDLADKLVAWCLRDREDDNI